MATRTAKKRPPATRKVTKKTSTAPARRTATATSAKISAKKSTSKKTSKRTATRTAKKQGAAAGRKAPARAVPSRDITTVTPRPIRSPRPSTSEMTEARVAALAKVFATLGARNAERWARDHVDKGTDELGRFVLLRALWLRVVEPGRLLAAAQADPQAGPALARMMQTVDIADLDALVRFAERTALADVCRVLDDPGADNDDSIRWAVFRIDGAGLPLWMLDDLRGGLEDSEP